MESRTILPSVIFIVRLAHEAPPVDTWRNDVLYSERRAQMILAALRESPEWFGFYANTTAIQTNDYPELEGSPEEFLHKLMPKLQSYAYEADFIVREYVDEFRFILHFATDTVPAIAPAAPEQDIAQEPVPAPQKDGFVERAKRRLRLGRRG